MVVRNQAAAESRACDLARFDRDTGIDRDTDVDRDTGFFLKPFIPCVQVRLSTKTRGGAQVEVACVPPLYVVRLHARCLWR